MTCDNIFLGLTPCLLPSFSFPFSSLLLLPLHLQQHIKEQQQVLSHLEEMATLAEHQRMPSSDLTLAPADGYRIIRRLSESVANINHLLQSARHSALDSFLDSMASVLPDRRDIEGAAQSLLRLQRTYDL